MTLLVFLGFLIIVTLAGALVAAVLRGQALARRLKAIDDPVLHLSRRDRRAHARKLLEREQQQYDLQRQRDLYDVINGNNNTQEEIQ
ncbi:hypothetical protein [Mycolicibacterium sp.]|uniref:hypothetical protein n=1 Tax=Mycolicibacterium sp. TaxID=2320850 RepID=UPI0037C5F579